MESGKYYVVGYGNNLIESMTKEQILAAITQAVESHAISDVDTGFVTTLKEQNGGNGLKIWVGTTAQYNAITTKETNCMYILTDDTELEDLETAMSQLETKVNTIAGLKGQVILNESVSYGGSLSVALGGDYNISQYTLVKVGTSIGEVLCSVWYDEENNAAMIRGQAPDSLPSTTADSFTRIASVRLRCNTSTNTLTDNATTATLISASGSVQISQITIDKIVGVY